MANPGFRREFINTSADLLNSWFRESRALTFVGGMRSALAPAMSEHFDRWQTQSATNNWATQVKVLNSFASQRPILLRQQFVTQLHLAGYAPLTLVVSNPAAGQVRVNQLWINSQLPGAGETPYPWHGWYFRGIPLDIEALPAPGWEFADWVVSPTTMNFPLDSPTVQLTLTDSTILTARFRMRSPRFLNVKGAEPHYFIVVMEGLIRHHYRVQSSSDLKFWSDSGSLLTNDAGQGSFRWEIGVGGQVGYLRLADGPP